MEKGVVYLGTAEPEAEWGREGGGGGGESVRLMRE
jgi:hypothetical protein